MKPLKHEYNFFEEYRDDVLADRPVVEQLSILDDEIANKALLPRYIGPVDDVEWSKLESTYHDLFTDFLFDRLDGVTVDVDFDRQVSGFDDFRKDIAELNESVQTAPGGNTTTIAQPVERLLTKELRQLGYDPDELDVAHIQSGGTLYLLELFATALQQEALDETAVFSRLVDVVEQLSDASKREVFESLSYPVLMVDLWKNQREGLECWLDNDCQGILEMATATGKTVAGIAAIAHLCGDLPSYPEQRPQTTDAQISIIAHSNAILSQWEREIRDMLGLSVSSADRSGRPDTLQLATGEIEFHTIHEFLPQHGGPPDYTYDLVICDEAHHYANDGGFGGALDAINRKAMLGLSATIGDEEGVKRPALEERLGEVVYTYGVEDAQRDGVIPDFDWTVHPTELDPAETEEWERTTNRISNLFKRIRRSRQTQRILESISVPFTNLDDLGDFIRAYQTASLELDDEVPDDWENLHLAMQTRSRIRHKSRPKIKDSVDLAANYLADPSNEAKIVMFTMNIDVAEHLGDALESVTDSVFVVHSEVASSTRKKDRIVRERIDQFAASDHGVLIAPKLLDEGIDVPDAEIGINVAGTRTKLQLVQRMGRILRRHEDQRPLFHHFVAVPNEHYLEGIDDKEYVQELNWVRELGAQIGQQPSVAPATTHSRITERDRTRGRELWAEDLLQNQEVETVQGSLNLEEIIEGITPEVAQVLLRAIDTDRTTVSEETWGRVMERLQSELGLPAAELQRLWWLFPVYRERPTELQDILEERLSAADSVDTLEDTRSDAIAEQIAAETSSNDEDRDRLAELLSESSSPTTRPGGDHSEDDDLPEELSQTDVERVRDIVTLAPTKNAVLADEWEFDSHSELHSYLTSTLSEYYTRNSDRYIVPTEEGESLVDELAE